MSDNTADMANAIADGVENREEIKFDNEEQAIVKWLYKKCEQADIAATRSRETLNDELKELVVKYQIGPDYEWDETKKVFYKMPQPEDEGD